METKAVLSGIAVVLTIVGYAPYIIDILKGKTKPHIFSWLSGSVAATIATLLQLLGGAGVGAWVMSTVAIACFIIFLLSFKYGTKDITKSDVAVLLLSFTVLLLWLVADQPVLSIILLTVSQLLAFLPTIRKSWHDPYSETTVFYQISGVRHIFAILALEQFNILTALYSLAWVVSNFGTALMLSIRRKVVDKKL